MGKNRWAQIIHDSEDNANYSKLADPSDDMVKDKLPMLAKFHMPLSPFLYHYCSKKLSNYQKCLRITIFHKSGDSVGQQLLEREING